MASAGFKQIFWLEWIHRLWGRLIGLAFIVPLIWFWATGRIERRLRPRLALLFVLGGLQGAVGWFMVASGFEPDGNRRVAVSAGDPSGARPDPLCRDPVDRPDSAAAGAAASRRRPDSLHWLAWACCACVALTMLAGGFVAGTHAGLDYNTFPLMDGRLVPRGYATA